MKTIIQKIGPLYGEAVNGTVFGQPNGSQAVLSLDITLSNIDATAAYVKASGGVWICKSDSTTAKYCDVSFTSPIPVMRRFALYSDSACTNQVTATTNGPAKYAGTHSFEAFAYFGTTTITPGTTYYGRVELIANGSIVKATTAITFTGV